MCVSDIFPNTHWCGEGSSAPLHLALPLSEEMEKEKGIQKEKRNWDEERERAMDRERETDGQKERLRCLLVVRGEVGGGRSWSRAQRKEGWEERCESLMV